MGVSNSVGDLTWTVVVKRQERTLLRVHWELKQETPPWRQLRIQEQPIFDVIWVGDEICCRVHVDYLIAAAVRSIDLQELHASSEQRIVV